MKVNLPVEFNRENYNLNHKFHIYKIKTMTDINFYKYPSKSIHKVLNYKQELKLPGKYNKELKLPGNYLRLLN